METNKQTLEILKKKSLYFYEKKLPVHIKTFHGFKNGLITAVEAEFIMFKNEMTEEIGEEPIFYLEMIEIELREPKRKKRGNFN